MVDLTFGQFVRVLVDMDLAQPLNYSVLVERGGFTFVATAKKTGNHAFSLKKNDERTKSPLNLIYPK